MGLDMYLEGRTFNWTHENPEMRDGFRVRGVTLDLGYWRKHPDLHGFIVQEFAGGNDDQNPIQLNGMDIIKIIEAVEQERLPRTTGFFFGESDAGRKKGDLKILRAALAWLQGATPPFPSHPEPFGGGGGFMLEIKPEDFANAKESREIFYRASW